MIKKFRSVTGLEWSYGKMFIPVTEIDVFTKKRVVRGDLGNRSSPVDRAHMKRP